MSGLTRRHHGSGRTILAIAALLLPACAGSEHVGDRGDRSDRQADDAVPRELVAAPRRRGKIVGGEKVARAIAWPAPSEIDKAAQAQLSPAFVAALADAPVPVLAPVGELAADAELYTGEHWAATTSRSEGLVVTLNASGQARVHTHLASKAPPVMPHRVRGFDGLVTQNEGIWSASWVENGVAYDLSVECADPGASECDSGAYVEQLAESLVVVGGRQVR